MPKIKVTPNKGLKQERGSGFHLLSSNSRGFAIETADATVTMGMVDAAEIATGIVLPIGAVPQLVALKCVSAGVDADTVSNWTANSVSAINVGGVTFEPAASNGVDLLTDDDVVVYDLAAQVDALGASDAVYASVATSTGAALTLTESETGADEAADTAASCRIVIQYLVPII